ncbi:MAG: uroporphyrinogen decarboxylase [Gammaproteobacteria bacterium]|nr:uroporphyrinogen decarboxylase [Gammaproteobacteria bacterium]MBL6819372.1 uroporphyrinogen decarboxylase [Gammaproteobacteria bacterium]MBL6898357.1 uroporphyrinogen decarboxylase [Gammaproteobacteria bacterium]
MSSSKHLLINSIHHEKVDRTPIWIMRQAGRYLPEYIKTKNKAGGFMGLIRNPELACEVTLQPLKRYPLDSAILFSDILVVADMFNMNLRFEDKKGPVFDKPLRSETDFNNLPSELDLSKLSYVNETIKNIKTELNDSLPLIGFIGSPWTVATYLIEGNSTKKFTYIKNMMRENSNLLDKILDMITRGSIHYVNEQISQGVDAFMIFDTWGGLLSKKDYYNYSLKYIEKIISSKNRHDIPIIYYSRSNTNFESLKNMGIDCVGISSDNNLGDIYNLFDQKIALQGNLNTEVLKQENSIIKKEINKTLKSFPNDTGHIFNLGSGITPDIHPDKVAFLIDQVNEISSK